jgi:DNA-binding LacI/PurR family transcriptional regulator
LIVQTTVSDKFDRSHYERLRVVADADGARGGPTMASIGRSAGVSRQTVWNVLHSPDRVSPATRERVEQAIREYRYRPNRVARSLRTRSAHLLGYCVGRRTGDELYTVQDRFLHAITEAAEDRGYHVLLFTAEPTDAGLASYAELLAEAAVDGFVLSDTVVDDPRPRWLTERGVPFVAFGRTWSGTEHGSWVDVDNAAGTEAATAHLHEQGHRRIAFLGWPEGSGVGDDRAAGWARARERLGPTTEPATEPAAGLVARCENDSEAARACTAALLDAADPPTALVCASDLLALGALTELRARGLVPGREVGVVGFDNAAFARLPGIELSSLDQPIERAGATAVRLLVDALTGDAGPHHLLLEPSLRIRSSSVRSGR